jgi:hypothetical protein
MGEFRPYWLIKKNHGRVSTYYGSAESFDSPRHNTGKIRDLPLFIYMYSSEFVENRKEEHKLKIYEGNEAESQMDLIEGKNHR